MRMTPALRRRSIQPDRTAAGPCGHAAWGGETKFRHAEVVLVNRLTLDVLATGGACALACDGRLLPGTPRLELFR